MVTPLSSQDATPLAMTKKDGAGLVANKCDLCLTDSHDPPCVACCPYDAAHRVYPAEAFRGLKGRANPA
jgi:Fe-S-cluster-containing hydrogenase component 2